jgi:hypothetical protein|tara:strand:- start:3570 stop:4271 length:702 start_codon:yes stop_codon:yes gene_type:complete
MAITRINVGTVANDSTGDDLRQAFVKVNNNFDELDARVVPQNSAENLGTGEGVFYTKEVNTLNFRSLIGGSGVSLVSDGTSITITNTGSITLRTDGDTLSLSGANREFGINGGQNINTTLTGSNVNVAIDPTDLIAQDTNPALGAALNANTFNINNVGSLAATTITATTITGALDGTVNGENVSELARIINGSDYGAAVANLTTGLELLFLNATIDYGTVTSPSALVSDYGTL